MYAGIIKILVVVAGLVIMKNAIPRGIRNNNPLNIRENHLVDYDWQGEHFLNLDNDFEEFTAPIYGLRAGARVLRTYRHVYGLNTISGIINRFAPPSENNTQAYIASVSQKTGINPDQPLTDSDYPPLMAAMIHHENGQQPYAMNEIIEGFNLGFYS